MSSSSDPTDYTVSLGLFLCRPFLGERQSSLEFVSRVLDRSFLGIKLT